MIGMYSDVYIACNRISGIHRAVKIIKKHLMRKHPNLIKYINSEIVLLTKIVQTYSNNES